MGTKNKNKKRPVRCKVERQKNYKQQTTPTTNQPTQVVLTTLQNKPNRDWDRLAYRIIIAPPPPASRLKQNTPPLLTVKPAGWQFELKKNNISNLSHIWGNSSYLIYCLTKNSDGRVHKCTYLIYEY